MARQATRRSDTLARSGSSTSPTGEERRIGGGARLGCGVRWLPDGGLVFISDADGWFQVVRRATDLTSRTTVTAGEREHGEPGALFGSRRYPSPDGTWSPIP